MRRHAGQELPEDRIRRELPKQGGNSCPPLTAIWPINEGPTDYQTHQLRVSEVTARKSLKWHSNRVAYNMLI
ncbi:unnamed protein product [Nezara viridula]|uniref:Uncharacterized protein n=1 Tax=Nezara viridula TaxID=85310 RepID=A0A9P0E613_NEZVI|nr:unnamed protein product [Nezara viridula]